jgi:hypothetical protein
MIKLNGILLTILMLLGIVGLVIVVPFYIYNSVMDQNLEVVAKSMECQVQFSQDKDRMRCINSYMGFYYRLPFVSDLSSFGFEK